MDKVLFEFKDGKMQSMKEPLAEIYQAKGYGRIKEVEEAQVEKEPAKDVDMVEYQPVKKRTRRK